MTNKRTCCIKDCSSEEGNEKDVGVTFHRFPQTNQEASEKWVKGEHQFHNSLVLLLFRVFLVCKVNFKPSKTHFVCSRHFRGDNFTILQSGKIILKCLTTPSIFPWNNESVVVTKTLVSSSESESPEKKKKTSSTEEVKVNLEEEESEIKKELIKGKPESKKKGSTSKIKEEPPLPSTPKKKSSKRLSAKFAASSSSAKKAKTEVVVVEKPKSKVPESPVSKQKNGLTNFVPGSSIEAQFPPDGKWFPVKVIEVDMDEREVLIRCCDKNNKVKTNINDEWITMDSLRLRPAQPAVTFEMGEKVLARWNDCRKFPATIKRVLENDTYDVLFDDGYPKIVRGVHINKYSPGKNPVKIQPTEALPPLNPLLLNPPSLIPDYIKEMKDLPKAPTEGEWCCVWVDDIPVGEESTFDGTHGKLPSIVVPDWRVKEGWEKHIYLRQNGKWDVLFVSPIGRKLRFKNELKAYLAEIGELYDPETWDFSLQKKRSKALGLCIQSDKLKHQLPHNFEVKTEGSDGPSHFINPFATLGALPYVQPNLVQSALSTHSEVSVGSLKVKVINNVFHCPAEGCDKQFRKENHLQLHIKHYHEDLAKLMGECPNMEDLAYLRTTGTIEEADVSIVKNPPRKSHGPSTKSTPTSTRPPKVDFNDSIKTEPISPSSKFHLQRSPILEEALKAPLVTQMKDFVIKLEPLSAASLSQFDPETLIPPHAVSRVQNHHQQAKGHYKRRIKLRFNPKSKKSNLKKKRFFNNIGSTVEGVIPYNEGPYLKNQILAAGSYVDENGEVIKIVRMKKEEIINCICGFGEEDGLMIQCDICLCWQHGWCHGIENSHQVPEKYICAICRNPYRQRASMRWTHDQDWLYDGKLPIANYHAPLPKQVARVDTLKNCHTLIGNLMELKKFMNSLDVKINIAENSEHPKLYLWSKKWEESPPRDIEMKDDMKKYDDDVKMQPIAPEPEAAIEPTKCRQTLLDHIQYQQNSVKSRLDNIESEIEGELIRYSCINIHADIFLL